MMPLLDLIRATNPDLVAISGDLTQRARAIARHKAPSEDSLSAKETHHFLRTSGLTSNMFV